jgi:hypothetical protein
MQFLSRLLMMVLGAFAGTAYGVVPESGLWWNPAESGRGYGIEVQDDTVFIVYYGFQPSGGMSAFFESAGTLNPTTGVVNAYWASAVGGQCFGCTYRPSQLSSLGQARFEFTSSKTGRILLPGNLTIPIQRQVFINTAPRDSMFGTWHLTEGALGLYFGENLWISTPETSPAGGFSGRRVDGGSQRILVGGPHPSLPNTMTILLDSSATYYRFYAFEWSFNRWVGQSWTYLKTSQPTGAGLIFFGSRLLGRNLSAAAANDALDGQQVDAISMNLDIVNHARAAAGAAPETELVKIGESMVRMEELRESARLLQNAMSSQ